MPFSYYAIPLEVPLRTVQEAYTSSLDTLKPVSLPHGHRVVGIISLSQPGDVNVEAGTIGVATLIEVAPAQPPEPWYPTRLHA